MSLTECHSITVQPEHLKIRHKIQTFKTQNVQNTKIQDTVQAGGHYSYLIKQKSNLPRRTSTRN